MASMVATLDISKPTDQSSGKPIEPTVEFDNPIFRSVYILLLMCACFSLTHSSAVIRTPNPFDCDIRPRSEQALRLIKQL